MQPLRSDAKNHTKLGKEALVPISVIFGAIVVDAATKLIAENVLANQRQMYFFGGIIILHLLFNHGAALGLGSSHPLLIALAVIAVTIGIIAWIFRVEDFRVRILLSLVAGGSIGNLADRIFRPPYLLGGSVVDWISLFHQNVVFNLADVEIRAGLVILVGYLLISRRRQGQQNLSDEVEISDAFKV